MKSNRGTQYTLRQIPRAVDERLRLKAREEGKSLNQTAVDVLIAGLALSGEGVLHHDLDFMVGAWVEDPAFEDSIQAQDQIDPHLWR
jgi:plasmid stability protein